MRLRESGPLHITGHGRQFCRKMSITTIKLANPAECRRRSPCVMVVAGSDNSGGAGIEADLKTLTVHGVYGLTCIAAITAQNTQGVDTFEATSEGLVRLIFDLNWDDFVRGYPLPAPLRVVKTGMLTPATVKLLAEYTARFDEHQIALVVDPVMIATSGDKLFDEATMDQLLGSVISHAYLMTPNYPEARALAKMVGIDPPDITTVEELGQFAATLRTKFGCANLLLKGGHIPFNGTLCDVLALETGLTVFESQHIDTTDTHGSGCTLALAIAANLAKGVELTLAVANAINYVHETMVSGYKLGHGSGPLYHYVKPPPTVEVGKGDVPKDLYGYFKQQAGSLWTEYVEHPILEKIATGTLPMHQFLYYLTQDYFYLLRYAQIHGLAAATAPTEKLIFAQAVVVNAIGEEITRHKAKMKTEYGVTVDDPKYERGHACQQYCSYLLQIAATGDFWAIKVAVAPCLHGYCEAGRHAKSQQIEGTPQVFKDWIGDYVSEWYGEAHAEGVALLNEDMGPAISAARLPELVEIWNRVCVLEANFWSEVLEIEE